MIISKIIFTIFIGLLLSVGLCVVCYIFLNKMYPGYRLQMRHHLFSLIVAVGMFVLYCFFSSSSAAISGIEQTFNSVKETIAQKSDIVDNIRTALSSGVAQQTVISEINNFISLSNNTELNKYIKDMDFTETDTENIVNILRTENISVKEKSIQIIDVLFDSYIGKFTKTLKRLWWILLISMVILQVIYWGILIYKADTGSGNNRGKKSRLTPKPTKKHYRRSSDYRARTYRR